MQVELNRDRNGVEERTTLQYRAIHRKVLIIAATRLDNTWKAYVHLVEGKSHQFEAIEAYDKADGTPLMESHARAFFGGKPFGEMKYAR